MESRQEQRADTGSLVCSHKGLKAAAFGSCIRLGYDRREFLNKIKSGRDVEGVSFILSMGADVNMKDNVRSLSICSISFPYFNYCLLSFLFFSPSYLPSHTISSFQTFFSCFLTSPHLSLFNILSNLAPISTKTCLFRVETSSLLLQSPLYSFSYIIFPLPAHYLFRSPSLTLQQIFTTTWYNLL